MDTGSGDGDGVMLVGVGSGPPVEGDTGGEDKAHAQTQPESLPLQSPEMPPGAEEDLSEALTKGQLSPLSGSYLLIVLAEPHSVEDRERIIKRLTRGLLSWDVNLSHVDLNCELLNLSNTPPDGDEGRNGEKLVQWASENLVVEVLIHSQVNTLLQCMKNLLSSFTRHRHIIHAGYTFQGTGSWILQDGTFSYSDFLELWNEPEVVRLLTAYKNDVSVVLQCAPESLWTEEHLRREPFSKLCAVSVNGPPKIGHIHNAGVTSFISYLSKFLTPSPLAAILESSDIVGNIRFSHPTLYVFPGGQGDAALFGVNGFNMLVDGGFARRACFWDFTRHLDRLDAVLLTRVNNNSIGGLAAILDRKTSAHVFPQIGHFFGNIFESPAAGEDSTTAHAQKQMDAQKSDDLILSLPETGQRMVEHLKALSLKPSLCYRDATLDPVNLYHKVGHGKLDLYILNPARDSRELKELLRQWGGGSSNAAATAKFPPRGEVSYPVLNLVSICALLVWQPASPTERITRILFPGSTPQHKIFESLGKLRHLDFLRHATCTAESLAAAANQKKTAKLPAETLVSEAKYQFSSAVHSNRAATAGGGISKSSTPVTTKVAKGKAEKSTPQANGTPKSDSSGGLNKIVEVKVNGSNKKAELPEQETDAPAQSGDTENEKSAEPIKKRSTSAARGRGRIGKIHATSEKTAESPAITNGENGTTEKDDGKIIEKDGGKIIEKDGGKIIEKSSSARKIPTKPAVVDNKQIENGKETAVGGKTHTSRIASAKRSEIAAKVSAPAPRVANKPPAPPSGKKGLSAPDSGGASRGRSPSREKENKTTAQAPSREKETKSTAQAPSAPSKNVTSKYGISKSLSKTAAPAAASEKSGTATPTPSAASAPAPAKSTKEAVNRSKAMETSRISHTRAVPAKPAAAAAPKDDAKPAEVKRQIPTKSAAGGKPASRPPTKPAPAAAADKPATKEKPATAADTKPPGIKAVRRTSAAAAAAAAAIVAVAVGEISNSETESAPTPAAATNGDGLVVSPTTEEKIETDAHAQEITAGKIEIKTDENDDGDGDADSLAEKLEPEIAALGIESGSELSSLEPELSLESEGPGPLESPPSSSRTINRDRDADDATPVATKLHDSLEDPEGLEKQMDDEEDEYLVVEKFEDDEAEVAGKSKIEEREDSNLKEISSAPSEMEDTPDTQKIEEEETGGKIENLEISQEAEKQMVTSSVEESKITAKSDDEIENKIEISTAKVDGSSPRILEISNEADADDVEFIRTNATEISTAHAFESDGSEPGSLDILRNESRENIELGSGKKEESREIQISPSVSPASADIQMKGDISPEPTEIREISPEKGNAEKIEGVAFTSEKAKRESFDANADASFSLGTQQAEISKEDNGAAQVEIVERKSSQNEGGSGLSPKLSLSPQSGIPGISDSQKSTNNILESDATKMKEGATELKENDDACAEIVMENFESQAPAKKFEEEEPQPIQMRKTDLKLDEFSHAKSEISPGKEEKVEILNEQVILAGKYEFSPQKSEPSESPAKMGEEKVTKDRKISMDEFEEPISISPAKSEENVTDLQSQEKISLEKESTISPAKGEEKIPFDKYEPTISPAQSEERISPIKLDENIPAAGKFEKHEEPISISPAKSEEKISLDRSTISPAMSEERMSPGKFETEIYEDKHEYEPKISQGKGEDKISPAKSDEKISPAKSEDKISPAKSEDKISPAKSEDKISPAKSDEKISPAKSDEKISSAKSEDKISPAEIDEKISPAKSEDKISPAEIDEKISLAKSEDKISPAKSEDKISPAKSDEKISSAKTEDKISPAEIDEKISPAKSEDKISPAEIDEKISLAKSEDKISPAKSEDKISPAKSEDKISPAKSDEKISPAKSDEKISSAKNEDKISPAEIDETISPAKSEDKISPAEIDEKISPAKSEDKISPAEIDEKISPAKSEDKISPAKSDEKISTEKHESTITTEKSKEKMPEATIPSAKISPVDLHAKTSTSPENNEDRISPGKFEEEIYEHRHEDFERPLSPAESDQGRFSPAKSIVDEHEKYEPTISPIKSVQGRTFSEKSDEQITISSVKSHEKLSSEKSEEKIQFNDDEKYEPSISPAKSEDRISPTKSDERIFHEKYEPTISHAKYEPTISPAKSVEEIHFDEHDTYESTISPVPSEGKISPSKYHEEISHAKYEPTISPVKSDDKSSHEKYEPTISPAKSEDRISPAKSDDKISLETYQATISPAISEEKIPYEKYEPSISPAKSEERFSPPNLDDKISHEKYEPSISPAKSDDRFSPAKLDEKIVHEKYEPAISPAKSDDRFSPANLDDKISHEKHEPAISPAKSEDQFSPANSDEKIAHEKYEPSISPAKSDDRISPAKSEETISPAISQEKISTKIEERISFAKSDDDFTATAKIEKIDDNFLPAESDEEIEIAHFSKTEENLASQEPVFPEKYEESDFKISAISKYDEKTSEKSAPVQDVDQKLPAGKFESEVSHADVAVSKPDEKITEKDEKSPSGHHDDILFSTKSADLFSPPKTEEKISPAKSEEKISPAKSEEKITNEIEKCEPTVTSPAKSEEKISEKSAPVQDVDQKLPAGKFEGELSHADLGVSKPDEKATEKDKEFPSDHHDEMVFSTKSADLFSPPKTEEKISPAKSEEKITHEIEKYEPAVTSPGKSEEKISLTQSEEKISGYDEESTPASSHEKVSPAKSDVEEKISHEKYESTRIFPSKTDDVISPAKSEEKISPAISEKNLELTLHKSASPKTDVVVDSKTITDHHTTEKLEESFAVDTKSEEFKISPSAKSDEKTLQTEVQPTATAPTLETSKIPESANTTTPEISKSSEIGKSVPESQSPSSAGKSNLPAPIEIPQPKEDVVSVSDEELVSPVNLDEFKLDISFLNDPPEKSGYTPESSLEYEHYVENKMGKTQDHVEEINKIQETQISSKVESEVSFKTPVPVVESSPSLNSEVKPVLPAKDEIHKADISIPAEPCIVEPVLPKSDEKRTSIIPEEEDAERTTSDNEDNFGVKVSHHKIAIATESPPKSTLTKTEAVSSNLNELETFAASKVAAPNSNTTAISKDEISKDIKDKDAIETQKTKEDTNLILTSQLSPKEHPALEKETAGSSPPGGKDKIFSPSTDSKFTPDFLSSLLTGVAGQIPEDDNDEYSNYPAGNGKDTEKFESPAQTPHFEPQMVATDSQPLASKMFSPSKVTIDTKESSNLFDTRTMYAEASGAGAGQPGIRNLNESAAAAAGASRPIPIPSAIPPNFPRGVREVIRTPDEVAELPMHEEAEAGNYEPMTDDADSHHFAQSHSGGEDVEEMSDDSLSDEDQEFQGRGQGQGRVPVEEMMIQVHSDGTTGSAPPASKKDENVDNGGKFEKSALDANSKSSDPDPLKLAASPNESEITESSSRQTEVEAPILAGISTHLSGKSDSATTTVTPEPQPSSSSQPEDKPRQDFDKNKLGGLPTDQIPIGTTTSVVITPSTPPVHPDEPPRQFQMPSPDEDEVVKDDKVGNKSSEMADIEDSGVEISEIKFEKTAKTEEPIKSSSSGTIFYVGDDHDEAEHHFLKSDGEDEEIYEIEDADVNEPATPPFGFVRSGLLAAANTVSATVIRSSPVEFAEIPDDSQSPTPTEEPIFEKSVATAKSAPGPDHKSDEESGGKTESTDPAFGTGTGASPNEPKDKIPAKFEIGDKKSLESSQVGQDVDVDGAGNYNKKGDEPQDASFHLHGMEKSMTRPAEAAEFEARSRIYESLDTRNVPEFQTPGKSIILSETTTAAGTKPAAVELDSVSGMRASMEAFTSDRVSEAELRGEAQRRESTNLNASDDEDDQLFQTSGEGAVFAGDLSSGRIVTTTDSTDGKPRVFATRRFTSEDYPPVTPPGQREVTRRFSEISADPAAGIPNLKQVREWEEIPEAGTGKTTTVTTVTTSVVTGDPRHFEIDSGQDSSTFHPSGEFHTLAVESSRTSSASDGAVGTAVSSGPIVEEKVTREISTGAGGEIITKTTTTTLTSHFAVTSAQSQQYEIVDDETYSSEDFSDSQLSTVPQEEYMTKPTQGHVQSQGQTEEFEFCRPKSHPMDVQSQHFGQPIHEDYENGNTTGGSTSTTSTTSTPIFDNDGKVKGQTTTTTIVTASSSTMSSRLQEEALAAANAEAEEIMKKWGKPLGLPAVHPEGASGTSAAANTEEGATATSSGTATGTATPKKDKPARSGPATPGKNVGPTHVRKTPAKHSKTKNLTPIHIDLAYVPHHGNSNYSDSEFFRLIRARYYVFSGLEPSRKVFDGLLEGKQAWDDKNLDVTIIPTYDTDSLGYWVTDREAALAEARIDLAPSASRCTINLQDHETCCSAYRLEF